MTSDQLVELRIDGLRSIDTARIALHGLTVLIGENGSGKSTIIEACELLRRASTSSFLRDFDGIHGGLLSLRRQGAPNVHLGATVTDGATRLDYDIVLGGSPATSVSIVSERLALVSADSPAPAPSLPLFEHDHSGTRMYDTRAGTAVPIPRNIPGPLLSAFGVAPPHPAMGRMLAALESIDVHLPFDATPAWAARVTGRSNAARDTGTVQRSGRLDLLGRNLVQVYQALRSEWGDAHWRETMEYVRLGLAQPIETVSVRTGASPGTGSLWVKFEHLGDWVPAESLSNGTLVWLAFVGMFRLPGPRSLLAFDEPELHLHPRLLARVVSLFQSAATDHPVLLATHSRRLLDMLDEDKVADSTLLCEFDLAVSATRFQRPDPTRLKRWLERYDGLGDVLDAGYEREVMTPSDQS